MGLFEKLDRLDDRVLSRLPEGWRTRPQDDPDRVLAQLACRLSAFLRRHPTLFALLVAIDLITVTWDAVLLASASTAAQGAIRGQRVAVGAAVLAMVLLLRQGRPRHAFDAASLGLGAIALQGIVMAILEKEPVVGALALIPLLLAIVAVRGRHRLARRCGHESTTQTHPTP